MADPVERAVRAVREAALPDPAFDDEPGAEPGVPSGEPITDALTPVQAIRHAGELSDLGAFVDVHPEATGTLRNSGLLQGIPVAVKDNFDVTGQWTRNGTPGLGHRLSTIDSTAWGRMRAAGSVLIGRTRMHELAWGVRTPGCVNPHVRTQGVGGSSGGSAAAVAAGIVPIALGTDTGGSIRIPAALCGVAGLRPTAGTISRRGVTPLAPSFDTVGPIARTARECLLVHAILGGAMTPAPADSAGLRVGWPATLWQGRVSDDVGEALEAAANTLRDAGVEIVDVDLPLTRSHGRPASYLVMLAESSALWAKELDDQPECVGPDTAQILRAGLEVSTVDYRAAVRVCTAIRAEMDAAFAEHRLSGLLLPTVPVTAAEADAEFVEVNGRTEHIESAYARLTVLASASGHPALSVPAGRDHQGLPIGAQLIGPRRTETTLCLLGSVIERHANEGH